MEGKIQKVAFKENRPYDLVDLFRKFSPLRRLKWHELHALQILNHLPSGTTKHVATISDSSAVEGDIAPVILEDAVGEDALNEVLTVDFYRFIDEHLIIEDTHGLTFFP